MTVVEVLTGGPGEAGLADGGLAAEPLVDGEELARRSAEARARGAPLAICRID
jgi:hypothetical protein